MSPGIIRDVSAMRILDNRLEPTLRVTVETEQNQGRADVPCGRSRGANEVMDLRDGGDRYRGRDVQTAIENINGEIRSVLVGKSLNDNASIDRFLRELDGTPSLQRLGGNAITGVSLACAKAASAEIGIPLYRYIGGAGVCTLPIPFLNLIEGGELAGTQLEFQEHQIVPIGADTFSEAIRMGAEVYSILGEQLVESYGHGARNVGDEGGYTPIGLSDPRDAFDLILNAVDECGYSNEIVLAADVAATHFFNADQNVYHFMGNTNETGEMIDFYRDLTTSYPVVSLEDPLEETDFDGFSRLSHELDVQIIGDDLFVSDPERLVAGIEQDAANCLLLKVNQVGTLTTAITAARIAQRNGLGIQVSERSGQTPDTWLAELAVGLEAGQIKTGISRSERTEQYNRLFEIEEELGSNAILGTVPSPSS